MSPMDIMKCLLMMMTGVVVGAMLYFVVNINHLRRYEEDEQ